eukprot:352965-Chlamydomonas_euryale.AAC.28
MEFFGAKSRCDASIGLLQRGLCTRPANTTVDQHNSLMAMHDPVPERQQSDGIGLESGVESV